MREREKGGRERERETITNMTFCSSGLKEIITPVLAHLIENDFSKMWSFNEFFREINKIINMKVSIQL